MMALDTNVVIRYALKDEPEQARIATDFMRAHHCLLLPTVMLESVWVMGSKRGYGLERDVIVERLSHVAGLPTVTVVQEASVAAALRWYAQGMDFADALHVALAGCDAGLVTFDRGIQMYAKRLELDYPIILIGSAP